MEIRAWNVVWDFDDDFEEPMICLHTVERHNTEQWVFLTSEQARRIAKELLEVADLEEAD